MSKRGRVRKGFIRCPNCKQEMPDHLVGCWNCSHIFNPRLVELYEKQKAKKKDKR